VGFRSKPAEISDRLSRLCETAGLVPVLPYEEVPDKPANDAATIYRENTKRIRTADAVVADISPFRGPHMDVGTAMEIGYAAALGKPILAYTISPVALIERIWCEETDTGRWDAQGHVVLPENLMITMSLAAPVATKAADAIKMAATILEHRST
jgi:nucleoside 2-deoxyribosyltransferase